MESSAKRAQSPVYFLDMEGLDQAEQQRVCQILGVPVPLADGLPRHSPAVAAVSHSSYRAPLEVGIVTNVGTNGGQTLVTPNTGGPVPVPAPPHLVQYPLAVVTNQMAAATMATAGVCVVSMPGGIPALPGVHLPGLPPQATFMHPDFFRNQPPPNLAPVLNPHVQEFVPGHEYVLPAEGGQPMPDMSSQPPQQLHAPPIFMTAPLPFVQHNYAASNGAMPAGPGGPPDVAIEALPLTDGGQRNSAPPTAQIESFPRNNAPPTAQIESFPRSSAPPTAQIESFPRNSSPQSAPVDTAQRNSIAPVGNMQASYSDLRNPKVANPQEMSALVGDSRMAPTVSENAASPSVASVSVHAPLNKSHNKPPSTDGGVLHSAGVGHATQQQGEPQGVSASPPADSQTQAAPAANSIVSTSSLSAATGEPRVPEKSKSMTSPDENSATCVMDFSDSQDSSTHSTSVLTISQATRTSTDGDASPSQTHNVQQSQTISAGTATDTAQLAMQAGFPALAGSGGESPVDLVNGIVSTDPAKDAVPVDKASSTQGGESKPVSSQPQAASSAAPASAPDPPKMLWANLFKGSNAPSKPPVVIYKEDLEKPALVSVAAPPQTQTATPTEFVSVADDTVAKKLGEFMSKVTLVHSSVALQPRGLVNRGNWCYVNATLQALVACPPFYHLFKKLADLPLLSRSASSTPILDSLVHFTSEFSKFERQGNTKKGKHVELIPGQSFEPDYIYKMLQLSKASASFKHGHQEDAEEFLSYVLDGLHDEMLSAIKHATRGENGTSQVNGFAGSPESERNAEGSEEGLESEDWQEVGPRNRGAFTRTAVASTLESTPISEMFVGFTRSGILQAAAKERATLQPFFTLQLDIQEEKVMSVREALEHFVCKESIQGYTCSKTGEEVEVVKRTTLEKLPPVLILHLKCFVYDQAGGCQKLLKNVKFDVDLQITKDLLSPTARTKLQAQQRNYKLFAVVFHHGKKATGGHYTTDVFHPGTNGWIHMDDSRILQLSEYDVLNYRPPKMPYLLYYRRRDLTSNPGSS